MKDGASVLVIDDCASDVMLLDLAFQEVAPGTPVQAILEGEEVMGFLDAVRQGQVPLPALIILDLNLPRLTGFELLARLKAEPCLTSVPVVVHSVSSAPQDREHCATLAATAYYTKAATYHGLLELVGVLTDAWMSGHRAEG
ncbi:response regulator [Deinococcus radiotolerans]|uniref:response regulator n=1 Tax=Deinococcus radiotolerans TaxID=1309407 RepID=UPI00166445DF|nr:response regulator [Deinococcus radiotolerans]